MKKLIVDYKNNMEINENMVIRGMPIEAYHKHPALSNSGIKTLLDCPARYYWKYLSGEYVQKEKPYFKIGKAAHCYILEGKETFLEKYWYNPYSQYKKEKLIEILQEKFSYDSSIKKYLVSDLIELLIDAEGIERKEIELSSSEFNQVVAIGSSINKNKYAKNAFSQSGEAELSFFWKDSSGIWLKCRPDFLPYDCLLVPDYKTAESVNPHTFYHSFIKYGYHLQAAFYRTGIKEVTGIDVESFFFIAQEKEPPFISQIYLPEITLINFGENAIKNGIKKYLECKENDIWETYSSNIIEMTIQTKPEDEISYFDKKRGILYAPYYLDNELLKYDVL